jgi:hypothetical protein
MQSTSSSPPDTRRPLSPVLRGSRPLAWSKAFPVGLRAPETVHPGGLPRPQDCRNRPLGERVWLEPKASLEREECGRTRTLPEARMILLVGNNIGRRPWIMRSVIEPGADVGIPRRDTGPPWAPQPALDGDRQNPGDGRGRPDSWGRPWAGAGRETPAGDCPSPVAHGDCIRNLSFAVTPSILVQSPNAIDPRMVMAHMHLSPDPHISSSSIHHLTRTCSRLTYTPTPTWSM